MTRHALPVKQDGDFSLHYLEMLRMRTGELLVNYICGIAAVSKHRIKDLASVLFYQ